MLPVMDVEMNLPFAARIIPVTEQNEDIYVFLREKRISHEDLEKGASKSRRREPRAYNNRAATQR